MIIFNYIFKTFLKFISLIILFVIFLSIIIDFTYKSSGIFATNKPSSEHIILFYLYQIPTTLIQIIPIAALFSSVITMILLSRTNEITAMRAAGMSPIKIAIPIILGGILLSITSVLISELIIPTSSKKMHYIEHVYINKKSPTDLLETLKWIKVDNKFFYFKIYDPITKKVLEPKVIELYENSIKPKLITEAIWGELKPDEQILNLNEVYFTYFNSYGSLMYKEKKDNYKININITPKKFKTAKRKPYEFSIGELYNYVKRGKEIGIDVMPYYVEMHMKIAFYLASVIVCLIGLQFGYKSERTMETIKAVIIAIGIGISYWLIYNTAQALAKRNVTPVIISAWAPNIIILAITLLQIFKAQKNVDK